MYTDDYLYIDAVQFVRKVKKGPLHETSPMLYDITAVPNWAKVCIPPDLLSCKLRMTGMQQSHELQMSVKGV